MIALCLNTCMKPALSSNEFLTFAHKPNVLTHVPTPDSTHRYLDIFARIISSKSSNEAIISSAKRSIASRYFIEETDGSVTRIPIDASTVLRTYQHQVQKARIDAISESIETLIMLQTRPDLTLSEVEQ